MIIFFLLLTLHILPKAKGGYIKFNEYKYTKQYTLVLKFNMYLREFY